MTIHVAIRTNRRADVLQAGSLHGLTELSIAHPKLPDGDASQDRQQAQSQEKGLPKKAHGRKNPQAYNPESISAAGKGNAQAAKSKRRRKPSGQKAPVKPSRYPVWDVHLRASHWLLTVSFIWLFASGQFGLGPKWLHIWVGYGLLTVLLFRVGWGFVGSDSARWSTLLPKPIQVLTYLPLLFSRSRSRWAGHNPVGALSTVARVSLLLLQSISGLFIETWGEYRGPLAERVPRDVALIMSDLHSVLRWPLLALILIHVFAVFAYLAFKRDNRISPMLFSGSLELEENPQITLRGGRRAWALWLACAGLVAILIWLWPVA